MTTPSSSLNLTVAVMRALVAALTGACASGSADDTTTSRSRATISSCTAGMLTCTFAAPVASTRPHAHAPRQRTELEGPSTG